jgi:hypothetical protein
MTTVRYSSLHATNEVLKQPFAVYARLNGTSPERRRVENYSPTSSTSQSVRAFTPEKFMTTVAIKYFEVAFNFLWPLKYAMQIAFCRWISGSVKRLEETNDVSSLSVDVHIHEPRSSR